MVDGDSWPGAGHRGAGTGQPLSEEGGPALGSGSHSAPWAAAQEASWLGIPDSLLMSGEPLWGQGLAGHSWAKQQLSSSV